MDHHYVIFGGRVGYILNPDAEIEDDWLVSFSPDDIREVKDNAQWFGEYEKGPANLRAALAALEKKLEPIGTCHVYPRPPYGSKWDGGHDFSRSICAGNFRLSGTVNGEVVIPVWIVTEETIRSSDVWAGYYTPTGVEICATSTSRGEECVSIPAGGYWCAWYGKETQVLAAFRREETSKQVQVDSLGRW